MIPAKEIQHFFFPLIPLLASQDIQSKILKNSKKSKTTILIMLISVVLCLVFYWRFTFQHYL
jgi:hypothetical protein